MNQSPSQDAKFQQLFTSRRDAVWVYCYRRLPRDDVQDAVAEVFLVVWRKVDQAPDSDEALLWLYGVARNVVRNFRRSSIRRQRLRVKVGALRQPDDPTPEIQVIRRAEDRDLLAAVDRLKPEDQELLRLHTWEELSLAEIASVVDKSTRSVESRLSRIRKRLAVALDVPPSSPRQVTSPQPIEEGGER